MATLHCFPAVWPGKQCNVPVIFDEIFEKNFFDPKLVFWSPSFQSYSKNGFAGVCAAAAAGQTMGICLWFCMLLILVFECCKMAPDFFQVKLSVKNVFAVGFAVAAAVAKPWAYAHGFACC